MATAVRGRGTRARISSFQKMKSAAKVIIIEVLEVVEKVVFGKVRLQGILEGKINSKDLNMKNAHLSITPRQNQLQISHVKISSKIFALQLWYPHQVVKCLARNYQPLTRHSLYGNRNLNEQPSATYLTPIVKALDLCLRINLKPYQAAIQCQYQPPASVFFLEGLLLIVVTAIFNLIFLVSCTCKLVVASWV
ncbi:unnamed protein product [Nesidiocoris tenuis]|uniref:Uncharacterized protein n=1 Tax=Nesidiocoris tenuis TaxID=355587 RepID=A0A6H5FZR5_9HEMI|nr:unnamed protein product [Nesidiocoris tenuis]